MAARRRRINPELLDAVQRSPKRKALLSAAAGFTHFVTFHNTLRADRIAATPLAVARLERVADAVGFPKEQIFLDGGTL